MINQTEPKQQLCAASTEKKELCLKDCPQAKKQLAVALSMFYDTLKIYGKTPQQMESVTRLFKMALADYTYKQIQGALVYYAKNYSEMPAPADIVRIIERNGKPPFSDAVYVSISKKQPCERTADDWEYMRDYERFIIEGKM